MDWINVGVSRMCWMAMYSFLSLHLRYWQSCGTCSLLASPIELLSNRCWISFWLSCWLRSDRTCSVNERKKTTIIRSVKPSIASNAVAVSFYVLCFAYSVAVNNGQRTARWAKVKRTKRLFPIRFDFSLADPLIIAISSSLFRPREICQLTWNEIHPTVR